MNTIFLGFHANHEEHYDASGVRTLQKNGERKRCGRALSEAFCNIVERKKYMFTVRDIVDSL
ncbi:hypothetical protein R70006_06314 [Paraburkholderia domus]|nr:hypothetical protein R70006_06314 [Paraburkholderia domus]